MQFLPIHLDTTNKEIWVVGGGPAAEAKLRTLVKSQAQLTVFADNATSEIQRWADASRVDLRPVSELHDMEARPLLIYTAQDSEIDNLKIAEWGREKGVLVNAADHKAACDFYSPAIVDRSPIVISIGSAGTTPGLARAIKNRIEGILPETVGKVAAKLGGIRNELSAKAGEAFNAAGLWSRFFANRELDTLWKMTSSELENTVRDDVSQERSSNKIGSVSLIGAGPGDFELLTLKAVRLLEQADVVIYDRLVGPKVLDLARREAHFIYVGKTPYQASIKQDEINEILVREALKGHKVVRLKGGDTSIFARTDEEISALHTAGIEFQIVPGITAASAAAAGAGLSLTTRDHNRSVTFMTGHGAKGYAEQDWKALAEPNARVAVYMGLGAARFIQGRLLLHGAAKNKPITVIENASLPDEKVVSSNLGNLPQDIEKYGVTGPAILLIGYQTHKASNAAYTIERAVS